MYIIQRNNKRLSKKQFNTYEEARSYVRKTIRKYLSMLNLRYATQDVSGQEHRNPAIQQYGYSIQSV